MFVSGGAVGSHTPASGDPGGILGLPAVPYCPEVSITGSFPGWCVLVEDENLPSGNNYGNDTEVNSKSPDRVHGNLTLLNLSRGPSDLNTGVFVTFNLSKLPTNATLVTAAQQPTGSNIAINPQAFSAFLRLYVSTYLGDTSNQVMDVYEANATWDDWKATWNNQPRAGALLQSRGTNCSTGAPPNTSPTTPALASCPTTQEFDVTTTIQTWRDHPQSYNGWVLVDNARGSIPTIENTITFFSNNDTDRQHHPKLFVSIDKNIPAFSDLRFNGRIQTYANRNQSFNLTFTAFDPKGDLRDVRIIVRNDTGQLFLNESVFYNHTGPTFFRNGPFNFSDGRYHVNVTAVDSDRNWNVTAFRSDWNFTIESVKPNVTQVEVSKRSAAQDEAINFTINLTDNGGIAYGDLLLTRFPGNDTQTVRLLKNSTDEFGNGTYYANLTDWAAGFYSGRFRGVDIAGNVNESEVFNFTITDNIDPMIGSVMTDAPTRDGTLFQEAGANLTFEVNVTDASLTGVTLVINRTGGNVTRIAMGPARGNWTAAVSLVATGRYSFSVNATDAFGHASESAPTLLDIIPREPPRFSALTPKDATYATAHPRMTATVTDANLDPDDIRMFVSENLQEERQVPAVIVVQPGGLATIVFEQASYFHQDLITVRVAASDRLGTSAEAVWNFTVDAQAPRTEAAIAEFYRVSGDVLAISPKEAIALNAEDSGSGVAFTTVAISRGDGTPFASLTYDGPFSFDEEFGGVEPDRFELRYLSSDLAGNVEDTSTLRLLVDGSRPLILHAPKNGSIRAKVTDAGVGIREAAVFYRTEEGSYVKENLFPIAGSSDEYGADLQPYPRGTTVFYYIVATDFIGNKMSSASAATPHSFTEPNHAPKVAIVVPLADSVLLGTERISWETTDPDSQPIVVDVSIRPTTVVGFTLLAERQEGTGDKNFDTRLFPDGTYELRVQASDTLVSSIASINIRINNTGLVTSRINVSTQAPAIGGNVKITATIFTPTRSVKAIVYRDSVLSAAIEMRDDRTGGDAVPEDGVFTATYRVPTKGNYRVDIETTLQDGSTEIIESAQTFTVETSLQQDIGSNATLIMAAAVAVGLIVAGAFVFLRFTGRV
ncbi:MAG: DNRLRE domain-containing protein [Euryarchaeota archaeon]|nr:DNRLRE domain-containing protein [Euryarchaeota archaeon]